MFDFDSQDIFSPLNEGLQSSILRKIFNIDSLKRYDNGRYITVGNYDKYKKHALKTAKSPSKSIIEKLGWMIPFAMVKDEDFTMIPSWDKAIKSIKSSLKSNPSQTLIGFFFNGNDDLLAISVNNTVSYMFAKTNVFTPQSFDFDGEENVLAGKDVNGINKYDMIHNIKTYPVYQYEAPIKSTNFGALTMNTLNKMTWDIPKEDGYVYVLDVTKHRKYIGKLADFRSNRKKSAIVSKAERDEKYQRIAQENQKARKAEAEKRRLSKFSDPFEKEIPKIIDDVKELLKNIKFEDLEYYSHYKITSAVQKFENIIRLYNQVYEANQKIALGQARSSYIVNDRDESLKKIDKNIKEFYETIESLNSKK